MDPYTAPTSASTAAPEGSRRRRLVLLIVVGSFGILVGSYLSAEFLYMHYPKETRSIGIVMSNTMSAAMSSPLSMSIGVLPALQFYRLNGLLVALGAMIALGGSWVYIRQGRSWWLMVALIGFILWSHNNFLSCSAMMSV